MWESYAHGSQGFVLAFDTSHPAFIGLRSLGTLGKVEYSDEPIPDFLTTYGVNVFFQKRTRYKFEGEWRSIGDSTDLNRRTYCALMVPRRFIWPRLTQLVSLPSSWNQNAWWSTNYERSLLSTLATDTSL